MLFPGPIARKLLEDSAKYYVPTTQSSRICPERREGPYVIDYDGYKFFDFHCDASANNLGAASDHIIARLKDQADTRNLFAEYHNAPNLCTNQLIKFLCERAPVKKPSQVFCSNSGAEANEAALKACRAYRHHRGEARPRVICFEKGFSGRTLGIVPATSSKPETQRDPFWTHCDRENFLYLPYPKHGADWSVLRARLNVLNLLEASCIICEVPLQGEGGMIPVDESALRYVYSKTQAAEVLWISDCIQCGMGRAGGLFGCDVFPWLKSDIITLGKTLGGGFPNGVTIMRKDLAYRPGEHSNTFGGGPMVMRVALEVIKEIDRLVGSGRIEQIEEIMFSYKLRFMENANVMDFRGMGAMWGVEFSTPAVRDRVVTAGEGLVNTDGCGLRLLGAGRTVVRLMPPLTVSDTDLLYALDLFLKVLVSLG